MLLAPHAPGIEAYETDETTRLAYQDTLPRLREQGVRWNGTLSLGSAGQEESFAIGPDGCVWNFTRPLGSATDVPGQLLPTGLKASCFAAGLNAQGQLVVWGAQDRQLNAVLQAGSGVPPISGHWRTTHCSKFSAPMRIALPALPDDAAIIRVLCEGVGEQLHVGVLVHSLVQSTIVLLAARWPAQSHDAICLQRVQAADNWQAQLLALQRMAS